MRTRNLFFRILAVVAGVEILVMVLLGLTGMGEGMPKTLLDAFLLSLLSAPFLYLFVVKNVNRRLSEQADLSRKVLEKEMGLKTAVEKQELATRLQSLVNNVPGMVYRGHRDWSLSFVGAEVEQITGYSAAEFLGGAIQWKGIIHPDDQEWLKESFRKAVKEKSNTLQVEYRIRHRNGGIRWIADRRQLIYDETGSFAHVDGLLLDVTEHKKTEEALRISLANAESEKARTEAIIAAIGDGLSIQDREYRILYQNQIHKNLIGDHVGEFCYEAYERQDRVCEGCPVDRSFRDGQIHKGERTGQTGEGPICVEITASPLKDASGNIIAGIELVRDMTARKRSEEALRDAHQRLSFHVQRMPLGYIVWDKEFRVVEWNPAAERIFGWKTGEALGKDPYGFIVPEDARPHVDKVWSKLFEGDETSYSLNANVRKDGKTVTCEWFNAPLRDASGQVSGVLSMVHDVTEKTQLERQLQTAQRMEAVGTLAGGVAHDFNNALTGIFGFGEMLKPQLAENERALSNLNEILRSAERAATLTRQLLTYSRRQIIEPVNLSLNKVLTDLLTLVSKVVGEHIEIRTFLTKELPTIRADVGQIEQVVMNLVLNARDAMSAGGQLNLETGLVHLDAEYVRYHPYMQVGSYVLLTVSDTGTGMDEKTQERVFEPFFTTKGPDKGTGLGLAMVYGIVKQHNGFIHLYSEPGKGTTFKVYFPPVEAAPDAIESRTPSEIRGGTETILLAEDDESVRMFVERTLTELGYTVLAARNGEDAVALFRENRSRISLALLDVVMPLKGGKEAYEAMRREKPGLKVIFMSGYTANAVHESFVLLAGVPFLVKPFGPAALAKKVREVLDPSD